MVCDAGAHTGGRALTDGRAHQLSVELIEQRVARIHYVLHVVHPQHCEGEGDVSESTDEDTGTPTRVEIDKGV